MNRKKWIYNVLWLQMLLGDEHEKEEVNSSEEEDNVIVQAALIRRLNTWYLKPRIYHVIKSKHWW